MSLQATRATSPDNQSLTAFSDETFPSIVLNIPCAGGFNSSVFLFVCRMTRATLLSILSSWLSSFIMSINKLWTIIENPYFFFCVFPSRLFCYWVCCLMLALGHCFLMKQRWQNSGSWRLFPEHHFDWFTLDDSETAWDTLEENFGPELCNYEAMSETIKLTLPILTGIATACACLFDHRPSNHLFVLQ